MPYSPVLKICLTRLKQFKREMAMLELYHLLILTSLFAFTLYITYHQTKSTIRGTYSIVIYAIILFIIHHSRNDKQFIKHIAQKPMIIFIFEYFFVIFPLTICFLVNNNLVFAFISVITPAIIAIMPAQKKANPIRINGIVKFINKNNYEFKSGIRKNFIFIIIVYSFILIAVWWNVFLTLILYILLSITFNSFFEEMEPKHFLHIQYHNASDFIGNKLLLQCKTYILIASPIIILLLINDLSIWYIYFGVLIYNIVLLSYYILLKYASYNGDGTAIANRFFLILGYLSIIFPVLIPLIIILTIRNYIKAIKNMQLHFNVEQKY